MDRFYFEVVFNWSIFLILFIYFAVGGRELLKLLIKSKYLIITMILGITFYVFFESVLSDMGFMKSFMRPMELSELQLSEGRGIVHHGSKWNTVYLERKKVSDGKYKIITLDFSLCIPYINENRLENQKLKAWHKGRMVYQLERNGKIIFSIDNANSDIDRYNTFIVPFNYFKLFFVDFFICMWFVQYIFEHEGEDDDNDEGSHRQSV